MRLVLLLLLIGSAYAAEIELNASSCMLMENSAAPEDFLIPCDASALRDGNVITSAADNLMHAGILALYNSSIEDCSTVREAKICADWYFDATQNCIGTQYLDGIWKDASNSCPASDGDLVCFDMTTDWSCSSVENALTRISTQSTIDGGTAHFDTSYLWINYSTRPSISSASSTSPVLAGETIAFSADCYDDDLDVTSFSVCSSEPCSPSSPGLLCTGTGSCSIISTSGWHTSYAACCDMDSCSDAFDFSWTAYPSENISLLSPANGTNQSSMMEFQSLVVWKKDTTDMCFLDIDGTEADSIAADEYDILQFSSVVKEPGLHTWSVRCTNTTGSMLLSEIYEFFIDNPDLSVAGMGASPAPLENSETIISVDVINSGESFAFNVTVELWEFHPNASGSMIRRNTIQEIPSLDTATSAFNYLVQSGGPHELVAIIDGPSGEAGNITEKDESNNELSYVLNVSGWQTYYGNFSSMLLLGDDIMRWIPSARSTILISKAGADISWTTLQALGRDIEAGLQPEDFDDLDIALGMENYSDCISCTYSMIQTEQMTIYDRLVTDIPVSFGSPGFATGILWDHSDGGPEYDGSQDVVFVSRINPGTPCGFGECDYEIRVPALLRNEEGLMSLYYETK